jgi:hypothetical protein
VVVTPAAYSRSLSRRTPPDDLSAALASLWWAKKGDWNTAHRIITDEQSRDAAWVHAYLHRVEGDLSNACYWYRQAHKPVATGDLEIEWAAITGAMLARAE